MSHEATQSGIKFIDFSTDNYYLLFVDNFGDTNIVDLTTKSQLRSTQNMEFTNEWTSEGIQISDKTKVNVSEENSHKLVHQLGYYTLLW